MVRKGLELRNRGTRKIHCMLVLFMYLVYVTFINDYGVWLVKLIRRRNLTMKIPCRNAKISRATSFRVTIISRDSFQICSFFFPTQSVLILVQAHCYVCTRFFFPFFFFFAPPRATDVTQIATFVRAYVRINILLMSRVRW